MNNYYLEPYEPPVPKPKLRLRIKYDKAINVITLTYPTKSGNSNHIVTITDSLCKVDCTCERGIREGVCYHIVESSKLLEKAFEVMNELEPAQI